MKNIKNQSIVCYSDCDAITEAQFSVADWVEQIVLEIQDRFDEDTANVVTHLKSYREQDYETFVLDMEHSVTHEHAQIIFMLGSDISLPIDIDGGEEVELVSAVDILQMIGYVCNILDFNPIIGAFPHEKNTTLKRLINRKKIK